MSDLSPSSRPLPLDSLDAMAGALLRSIAGADRGRVLLWLAAPTALLDHARGPSAPPNGRDRQVATARTMLSGLAATRGSSLTTVDGVLFAYEGANPAATLEPVIEALSEAHSARPVKRSVRPAVARLAAGTRDVHHARAAFEREMTVGAPAALERALQAAVRSHARATNALDALAPRLVVVASQHSTSSRAFIHAARERSIATAYLPHAPAADTYQYRDLPTDFAGLRGPLEVEFYRSLGACRDASVVGNPQARVDPPATLDPDGAVIFAPRPQPPEQLRAQVAEVDAAAPRVVVSPHPRMRGRTMYEGLWPAHWELHDGWTVELLRRGHPCVIQMSSGVAWEAMAHGVPVIELASTPATAPLYLVIREPYAQVCTPALNLQEAVAKARLEAADAPARDRLMAWAREWCATTGADAVAAAATWIDECLATSPPASPLLDHWAGARSAA